MGLDTVELIMRTEEVFEVHLPNEECGRVRTVGDLYHLVLSKLDLPYVSSSEIEVQVLGKDRFRSGCSTLAPWTLPDVWLTRKGIISNQLQVDIREVTENATFQDDLRSD